MKKLHRVVLAVIFAAMLALGALGFAACSDANNSKSQYTMTFMVGTMVYDSVTETEGNAYQTKEPPVRINNVFEGWSRTEGGEVEDLPQTMPSENRTYYAVFSAQFTLSLNAGIGELPDEQKTMSVKVGEDLYAKLLSVTPTLTDADATFDGWYLGGTQKITASAGLTMPNANADVVAKYSVAYTLNIYKELDLDSGEYKATPDDTSTGTAFVGDNIAGLPSYVGFRYNVDKSTALTAALGKNSAQNVLSVYYDYIGYNAEFSVNLPSDVEFEGETETMVCGYRLINEAPECGYEADGYRFQGWSTDPNGDIVYYPGDDFSVERSTIFYAVWAKGLTELTGLSSDRVYIMGKVEDPKVTVAYLERVGLDDVLGEYDQTTHVFTFKSSSEGRAVLLRGIADITNSNFTYLNPDSSTTYSLLDAEGDNIPTVKLNDDGTAVYTDENGDDINGSYVGSADGSLEFVVDGTTRFTFRLVMSDTGIASYELRGEEYGFWYCLSQDGTVDLTNGLFLDGYGYAVMNIQSVDTSSGRYVPTTFGGVYQSTQGMDGAYAGNAGKEIVAVIYNGSLNARSYQFLLMEGTYHAPSGTATYEKVYLERIATTIYAAPVEDEPLDTETADTLVLSGYGVLDDSATYTYKNNSETVTVKGKYIYDNEVGTVTLISATGDPIVFEISTFGEGESIKLVFAIQNEYCGQYGVSGLPSGYYSMVVYNDNVAAISFRMVLTDRFYGTVGYGYMPLIVGEYRLLIEGTEDKTGDLYEFIAEPDGYFQTLYNSFGAYAQSFYRFKFQFVYDSANPNNEITSISVVKTSDFMEGKTFTYDGVKYTLDGYGTAVGVDAEDKEIKREYAYTTSVGFGLLSVKTPTADNPKATALFTDMDGDGDYAEIDDMYGISNATVQLMAAVHKNDCIMLMLVVRSTTGYIYYPVSYGSVNWEGDAHTVGNYSRDEAVEVNSLFNALSRAYAEFKFKIDTYTYTDGNGQEQTGKRIFIYDFGDAEPVDSKYVIVNAAGDELTLSIDSTYAKYIKKGAEGENDIEIEGTYRYFDGNVLFIYDTDKVMMFRITNNVTVSFEIVGSETSYALDYSDRTSYLYLSGKSTGTEGEYAAIYYVYDDTSETFKEYNGVYKASTYGVQGYDFNYMEGDIAKSFTFALATNNAGITFFLTYKPTASFAVGSMSASNYGEPQAIGTITGGGYNDYTFTIGGTQSITGDFDVYNADEGIYMFSANGGTLYFKQINSSVLLMLDGTYIPEINGTFDLCDSTGTVPAPVEITVAGTPGSIGVPAVPEHKASITKIQMTGYGLALMYYTYNDEQKEASALYVQIASSTYVLLDGSTGKELMRVRLMYRTEEEQRVYYAEVADMNYFGMYQSDTLAVVQLNGFNTAYYVDSYGRVYAGVYTKDDDGVVCIRYIDTYAYESKTVYLTVDNENNTFTVVPAPSTDDSPDQPTE